MDKFNKNKLFQDFELLAHKENNFEYWSARELLKPLGYDKWDNFINVIEKAKTACEGAQHIVLDHFLDVKKLIQGGKGAVLNVQDFHLSRYACYLIAMNGDPRKEAIAFAQAYFALQTSLK